MPYPPRPQLQPLPQLADTARNGTVPSRHLQDELETYVVTAYTQGRSLREISELVDRSPNAVRRAGQAPGATPARRRRPPHPLIL